MNYIIHTDGGSRGNPGPAAVGVVIEICLCNESIRCNEKNRKAVVEFGKVIGETTNNVAEYSAVLEALNWLITNSESLSKNLDDKKRTMQFFLDSTLVVNQLNGLFKVKDANMRMLMLKVRSLEQKIDGRITYAYVPREQNAAADLQVNTALDAG